MALGFVVLARVIDAADDPRAAVRVIPWSMLLALTHAMAVLFVGLAAAPLFVASRPTIRRAKTYVVALAGSAIVVVAWLLARTLSLPHDGQPGPLALRLSVGIRKGHQLLQLFPRQSLGNFRRSDRGAGVRAPADRPGGVLLSPQNRARERRERQMVGGRDRLRGAGALHRPAHGDLRADQSLVHLSPLRVLCTGDAAVRSAGAEGSRPGGWLPLSRSRWLAMSQPRARSSDSARACGPSCKSSTLYPPGHACSRSSSSIKTPPSSRRRWRTFTRTSRRRGSTTRTCSIIRTPIRNTATGSPSRGYRGAGRGTSPWPGTRADYDYILVQGLVSDPLAASATAGGYRVHLVREAGLWRLYAVDKG